MSTRSRKVTFTAARDRTLLAMLLLHANHTVPVGKLVTALWTGTSPKNARSQLQGCVSRVRRQLADAGATDQVIVTEPEGYRLRAAVDQLDLLEYRSLAGEAGALVRAGDPERARHRYRAALALWHGPALAGLDRDTIRELADGLDEEHTRTLEEWLELELAAGSGGELVGQLTDLVRQHPYRERLHGALMLALYRADRQADALAAYLRIRDTLVSELGQEPSAGLRELHRRILAGDPELRPVPAAPAPAAPAPTATAGQSPDCCLPRTLADFTGRETELAWLIGTAEQADPYAPLVLAIDGMAGVGKTSLAVHAAHRLAPRYPDGQLFIDLRGHSQQRPLTATTALDTLLRQLGIPSSQIPASLDERSARWRAELATRRVLVLLDNAASTAQVAPLLPTGAGCLALVTSRRRLVDLDGARPRSVETLRPEEAVALLTRIVGARVDADPGAADEVAKRCGHLPLALRLAAARLAHRPGWQVRDLADRLADPYAPLAELTTADRAVTDAFALSYAHLSPPGQRLFRLLGLHPGCDFDAPAAAAAADLTLEAAQRTLDELVDGHLIQEPQANRYRLHDLIRVYAAELARTTDPAPQRTAAAGRLLDYYLHAAAAAGHRLESASSRYNFRPGAPLRPDLTCQAARRGVGWLDTERANLVAAVRYAAELGLDRYTWLLARACWQFLLRQGRTDNLIETHRLGLAAAERAGDAEAAASMHNYLASAYYWTGRYPETITHVRQAMAWREKIGDRAGLAIIRKNLAMVYASCGRPADVRRQLEQALVLARRCGSASILASVVVNAGGCYLLIGEYQRALWLSRQGLALAREAADEQLLAIALGNLGSLRVRLGQPGPALRLLTTALGAKLRHGVRYGEGETLNELGVAHRMLGRLDEAVVYHHRGLAVLREIGDPQGEYTACNELGRTLLMRGDRAAALELHQRALAGTTRIQHPLGQARSLEGIAACLRETDPAAADRHWRRARQLYRELQLPDQHRTDAATEPAPASRLV